MHRMASLTGSLLVSKGDAAPSESVGYDAIEEQLAEEQETAEPAELDNVETLPMRHHQQRPDEGYVRVSLRINAARHLRLRLASAHLGVSNHGIMVAAIDHYIDNVLPKLLAGRCACLEKGEVNASNCAALGFGRSHADHKP
jgi:hypothetical protein